MTAPQQGREALDAAIRALEAQRGLLGDAVVDLAVAGLRAKGAAPAPATPVATLPAEPAQTLRQVSILFLDVVGSTTLSQRLDPETISAVMDDALARGTAVVVAHRGRVLQYAGDNILAAFGADEAREDDAERAVHCGLALLELGQVLGAEVLAAHGHAGFNVRVGIHTGGVLLGGGVDAEGTIRGIAVNIAARMEQTAPAGALRISHDTYAQVRGLFEVEAQEPLAVKGVDAPIQSYLVSRAKPRNFRIVTRGIEGVATRMIGREAELEALQAAFLQLFAERKLAAVTVVADAGIGKSRLLYEFAAWSEARPEAFYLFRGRATPATGTQAFGLLRDILAWRFQIADDDSLEAARQKMEAGIVPLFVDDDGPDLAEAHAHLLGHLIGIEWKDSRHIRSILDDPRQIRNRAFHTAAQLLRRVGATDGSPVILQLEDLHWADDESLDFLNHLCEVNRDVPLLVLAFTRPTLFERRTDWRSSEDFHRRIDLAALDSASSRLLAVELLKKLPEVPTALQELLTGRADGNPFYMEELVKMLIDRGAIQTGPGTGDAWTVDAERLLVTQVPATLTGVLQARLDGLPKPEQRALQQASVVGAVFWDQALAAIEAHAVEQLPALVQRALALPRADAVVDGLREYAFRHQLLHQVIYDTVLKRHKREGHARVAHWLARLAEQEHLRSGDFHGLAAEHFEQAGEQTQAAEFHARAADGSAQRFAHERVLVHAGQGLKLLEGAQRSQPELRWRLLCARERTLGLLARRDEQAADLRALALLADELDDDGRRAEVAWLRTVRAMRMADVPELERAAQHGIACATRAGDDRLRLSAMRQLALARVWQGDHEAGKAMVQEALAEARNKGLQAVEARLLNVLALALEKQGDRVACLGLHEQILRLHRDRDERTSTCVTLMNLGAAKLHFGNHEPARCDLEEALQMFRAIGDHALEGTVKGYLSVATLWQGDAAKALALASSAVEIAKATRSGYSEVVAWHCLADAEFASGRWDGARHAFLNAQARGLELRGLLHLDASAGLARVAWAQGVSGAALEHLQPVFDLVAAGGSLESAGEPRRIELTCHQVLLQAGDPRADEWLVRAHTALMAQADAITDARLRQSFLRAVPHHRDIVAAGAARLAG